MDKPHLSIVRMTATSTSAASVVPIAPSTAPQPVVLCSCVSHIQQQVPPGPPTISCIRRTAHEYAQAVVSGRWDEAARFGQQLVDLAIHITDQALTQAEARDLRRLS